MNFLGFNVRRFQNKLLAQPENGKTHTLVDKIKVFLNSHHGIPFQVMLIKLNRLIRGWAQAYRRVVAKKRMGFVDRQVYFLVSKWLKREHRSKTWAWIARKYRQSIAGRQEFCATYKSTKGDLKVVRLFRATDLPIRYHVKVIAEATPYDPAYREYFANREKKRKRIALKDRMFLNATSFQKLAG